MIKLVKESWRESFGNFDCIVQKLANFCLISGNILTHVNNKSIRVKTKLYIHRDFPDTGASNCKHLFERQGLHVALATLNISGNTLVKQLFFYYYPFISSMLCNLLLEFDRIEVPVEI